MRHRLLASALLTERFDALLVADRRVRPTALLPLWHLAGFALGAGTALMGEKAAHACTVAVEEAIDEHYAAQIAALDGEGEEGLRETFEKFRQEELEHHDTALDMGKSIKIYVVGADDEFPDWESLPPDEICSCVDSLTGLDYRSVRQPESLGIASLGCRLIERTCEAQTAYEQDESSDWYRERWRSWFERLENARNLSRVFDR